jgi:hypothetical protein
VLSVCERPQCESSDIERTQIQVVTMEDSENVRVPPLNLTASEINLLAVILQHHADSGMQDEDLEPLKRKVDHAQARAYSDHD